MCRAHGHHPGFRGPAQTEGHHPRPPRGVDHRRGTAAIAGRRLAVVRTRSRRPAFFASDTDHQAECRGTAAGVGLRDGQPRPASHAARDPRPDVPHRRLRRVCPRTGDRQGDLEIRRGRPGQQAWRRLLAGRRGVTGSTVLGSPRRADGRARRQDRHRRDQLRRARLPRLETECPRRRGRVLHARFAAGRLPRHHHHRRQQRRRFAEHRPLRRHSGLGCAQREAAVVVSHGSARGRARRRDVGRRELEEPFGHQRMVVHDRRPRARPGVRADGIADLRLLRRRSQRAGTSTATPSSPSTPRPAS